MKAEASQKHPQKHPKQIDESKPSLTKAEESWSVPTSVFRESCELYDSGNG